LLRSKSEVERLEAAASLAAGARELTRLGIRLRHPQASEAEQRAQFIEIVYGAAALERLKGR
jgi:hypothetical protein